MPEKTNENYFFAAGSNQSIKKTLEQRYSSAF
jgi:GT2 family glycosyltransferase